jgi:ribosome assembly protein YihI (activator of Der GTPase)
MRDLRRDHINVAHKDPRNNSLKEIPLETASNPTNEDSSKIPPKMQKKKNAQD